MKAIKSIREMLAEGKELEQAGQLPGAAAIYQKILDDDGRNPTVIGRLLVIYRRLKEYDKELAVIDGALAAYEQQDKTLQEKWIKAHPGAAGAGKAIFRKLGGAGISAMGANPMVNRLLKRKALVEKRLEGGKKKKQAVVRRIVPKAPADRRKEIAKQKRKEAAEQKRNEREERKQAAAAARQKAAEDRRLRAEARKMQLREARAAKQKAQAEKQPSLFIVSLQYLVPPDKIDALMSRHMAFLDKHYKQGDFLVSGRQIPRTGGIIIARGKNRAAIERLMHQDPFVKEKLANIDIVEFAASQVSKGLERWVKG